MRLAPHEQDRLLVHVAAQLAQQRRARGLRLNHPESVAVLTSFLLEGAPTAAGMTALSRCARPDSVVTEVVAMLADAPVSPSIPAGDLERAKRFYRDTLGLKVSTEMDQGVAFECGGTQLYVYPTASAGQAAHTLAGWTVTDLDAEMADLRARGVTFEEYDLPGIKTVDGVAEAGGVRGAWFKDSEGNILGIMERRP